MTNKELLDLIGEIDGITLRSVGRGVGVYLQIGDREFELMTDSGDCISHHITRIGIATVIGWGGQEIAEFPTEIERAKT